MSDRDSPAPYQVGSTHLAIPDEGANVFSTHLHSVYNNFLPEVVQSAYSRSNDTVTPALLNDDDDDVLKLSYNCDKKPVGLYSISNFVVKTSPEIFAPPHHLLQFVFNFIFFRQTFPVA
jgi:hypothetical protein